MADNTLSFPSDLMAKIESAAHATDQTPEEWAAEAVQRQLKNEQWRDVLDRNERHVRALGLKESDVPHLVDEARAERRR